MSELPRRVLIVDNDEGLVEALSIRLSDAGFDCTTASSGSQGISLFQDDWFDVVLTDLNMPSGDGLSLIRGIRSSSELPVVVMTGFESSYSEELQEYGQVFLVRKPFEIDSLIDEIEIAIGLSASCVDDGSLG
ncbi:MAG: response regulator [Phycisphaerales bacterium]|nr:response regulator [Phycisphaerales bacterium]